MNEKPKIIAGLLSGQPVKNSLVKTGRERTCAVGFTAMYGAQKKAVPVTDTAHQ